MSIESVNVSAIMVRSVKTAREAQSVKVVAKIMTDNDIGSVVIVDEDQKPAGIITERDVVRVAGSASDSGLQIAAREVMSKPLITIRETGSIKDAIQQMEAGNIRRLPVVDARNRMVGIVTDKDIFRALARSQTLVTSFCESLMVEYRPVYERLSDFMLGDMPVPGGKPNENF